MEIEIGDVERPSIRQILDHLTYQVDMLVKAMNRCPECWHYGFGLVTEGKCELCNMGDDDGTAS